jgi:DNA polymerase I-like protein with 3'-5' exonuclease and polymerase domains
MLARIEFNRRLRESGLDAQFICTVHDSLVADVPEVNVNRIAWMLRESIEAVPELCKKSFNYDFSLPLTCEVQVGQNKFDMHDFIW